MAAFCAESMQTRKPVGKQEWWRSKTQESKLSRRQASRAATPERRKEGLTIRFLFA
jgi:hypothetical protein